MKLSPNEDLNLSELFDCLLEKIEAEKLPELAEEILKTTKIEDRDSGQMRTILFHLDFIGAYSHLFKLLKEVLMFQYADFLAVLADKGQGSASLPRLKAKFI